MNTLEILPGFFFVERGYLNANHFVYRCNRPVLIDSGYVAHVDHTQRLLSDLRLDLARTALIVNTHCHCDHIGGNHRIQKFSGCEIALHNVGRHFIDTRDDWSTWWRYYDQEAEFFDCTRGLEDGDVVVVGPYEFQVIYTPGHASDGIVLYHAGEKILISSDALWEKDIPVITLRIEGSRALFDVLASLEKLRHLEVCMVYPGHGTPFSDFKKAIARSEKRIRAYLQRREDLGNDQLKRIIVYTVLMRPGIDAATFFEHLMGTIWFPETCDFFFDADYRKTYDEVMAGLVARGILRIKQRRLFATVAA